MQLFRCRAVVLTAWLFGFSFLGTAILNQDMFAAERVPWTASKLVGSPEPPLPYVLERAYPVEFSGPISLNRIPQTPWLLVSEQHGKVFAFHSQASDPKPLLLVDFNQSLPPKSGIKPDTGRRIEIFSLAFHPQFDQNRFVYVCYIVNGGELPTTTHISRFEMGTGDVPSLVVDTEFDILACEGGGHNGCTLAFDNEGLLYISIGDLESPNPPDPRDTGQDVSDFYASILRIDIDHVSGDVHYAIPKDNPFVDLAGARPEVYAYGLRNPFRMSFDPPTGDLWVGDVGWEAWEMVYRVVPGGNYGWAIKEGPGDVKTDQPVGPTPILPADIALGHAEAASVTGGMVYRGQDYPDLYGQYVFGDWITRKFWAASFNTSKVTTYREIAVGRVKPICFETDSGGELLILDYSEAKQAAGIFRLVPNPALKLTGRTEFPRRLSQTGLFEDVAGYRPTAGVASYALNAPMWMDGARAEYLLAIPGSQQAKFYQTPQKTFDWFKTRVTLPTGSVLAKTYSFDAGNQQSGQKSPQALRVETQLSLKDEQGDWQFYTYRWNESGTDALLVAAGGDHRELSVHDRTGQPRKLTWQFASRTSCRICHTPWMGETLGFVEPQLRDPRAARDSWRELLASGHVALDNDGPPLIDDHYAGMVAPDDPHRSLDRRTRSYLHSNCAHCHLFGGNASTAFDISFDKLLSESKAMGEPPMRGELGLPGSKVISPGKPTESILLYRLAKSGSGRMPHVGSQEVDPLGVQLVRQWIAQLPSSPEQLADLDALCAPRLSPKDDLQPRRAAYKRLLSSVEGAMELSGALSEDRVPQELVREIVDAALRGSEPIRDVIEPFAEADQRIQRLGSGFAAEQVLSIAGDARNGQQLFAGGVGTCSSCHKIAGVGKDIGPDLSKIATKLETPEKLLASIMRPSEQIEEAYRAAMLLTVDGVALTGRVLERTDAHIVLQDATGNTTTVPVEEIEIEKAATLSLMPEQLLAPLTPQQAADLIAFLQTLGSAEK